MTAETAFIDLLRGIATDPAARDLMDDAAVLTIGPQTLILTKDLLIEGVHYLPQDPPEDVAWKLVAVNLSDLAAKGARPVAALLGISLSEVAWDKAFAEGLRTALDAFELSLIGGDTVSSPGPRVLSFTAIGESTGPIPSRAGAKPADDLWVSGSIGDAGAGLAILRDERTGDDTLVRRYRAPRPRLEAGQALAPLVTAMMDISDGLLIDASRLAHASKVHITLALDTIPLSAACLAALGEDRAARLRAATAGDDYELLFAAPADARHRIVELSDRLAFPLTRIGACEAGAGLTLHDRDGPIPLPDRLGWEHDRP